MTQPVYIAFEGPEACGISTQAQRLADSIGAVITRETGGTDIGTQLRSILHNVDTVGLDDHAETLIVAADRAQHLAEAVRPALERGEHVVSDRSMYPSLAYQGYRGLPVDDVRRINEWAIGSTWPDLVILLKTDDVTLQRRMNERDLDRIEQAGSDFHRRVREGFADMAAADPNRWYVVDASTPADETAATIRKVVSDVWASDGICVGHGHRAGFHDFASAHLTARSGSRLSLRQASRLDERASGSGCCCGDDLRQRRPDDRHARSSWPASIPIAAR